MMSAVYHHYEKKEEDLLIEVLPKLVGKGAFNLVSVSRVLITVHSIKETTCKPLISTGAQDNG